jgi:hypothetical protein
LSLEDWLIIVAGTSVVLWVGEIWRLVGRIREGAASARAQGA